ncbi:Sporulation-specific protein spo7 [Wallemia ichthyophaga EXF-994]|uniref:Transmembrane protein 188 n=1 Tax=Wallemia ichthyophaga (strain EXF-994 / CBS 113033) TaxID=1299270 RepID=R9AFC4_WALI9|nr:Sporulation-specific protein spo7 [Wallemia ichthyophaga EXF-994]EOR00810.1 Sporulation-specific protein spo7 [Wallemia ichthyophaga EXF-994]TIB36373.1 hypothetical protein E3P84_01021 [Wallemia ichthyophaga]TIB42802.1 hypothetical protein E3P83_01066 [Wallemia ichthyophaga]
MTERTRSSKRHWCPPPDQITYRELLRFEERLKQNATALRKRRRRYELFLLFLISTSGLLSWNVIDKQNRQTYRGYAYMTMLTITLTTLILFFVSGVYSERITYANRYVPHCNRALRSFNMALNMRLQSPTTPFSLFRRPAKAAANTVQQRQKAMSNLPPTTNPRGELVFSHRVDKSFRDGYDKYRAAFERKRTQALAAKSTRTPQFNSNIPRDPISMRGSGSGNAQTHTRNESFSFILKDHDRYTCHDKH